MTKDPLNKIRIGTRASNLALAQVNEFCSLLKDTLSQRSIEVEIVPIITSGDQNLHCNLAEIGGKGLFIKELERALIHDKIDIAVHSAKDVPPALHEETILAAFTKRYDARDCLISKNFNNIDELPKNAVIGTSSPRRKSMLLRLRPDLQIVNYRGNVMRRLQRAYDNEVDATILANCGLERLSKNNKSCPVGYDVKNFIDKELMLPSGGQGAMAIQIKRDNFDIYDLVRSANDFQSEIAVRCERAFLGELGASCLTPVGVYATINGDILNLETIILDYDGSEVYQTKSQAKSSIDEAISLGKKMAKQTKLEATKLLAKICY